MIQLDLVLDAEVLHVLPAVILIIQTDCNMLCSTLKAKD